MALIRTLADDVTGKPIDGERVNVRITAYDAEGNVVGIRTLDLSAESAAKLPKGGTTVKKRAPRKAKAEATA